MKKVHIENFITFYIILTLYFYKTIIIIRWLVKSKTVELILMPFTEIQTSSI